MAEWRDSESRATESRNSSSSHQGREGVKGRGRRWFVLAILTATPFFAVCRSSVASTATPAIAVRVAAAAGSMNLFERELFAVLAWVHGHLVAGWPGSWGWAIVALTVGINLAVLPLRIGAMRSGAKRQRLQPQIQAILERYKQVALTDPRQAEKNAEILKLQRDNGVDVFGGCLPLLIQMPLWMEFFGMLRKAVALRSAGWLWLRDLSVPDPLHILPVLMVLSQLAVQWITPSPAVDPAQQRMVAAVTAILFGYISWHYASGLALYSLTSSLFSIATQVLIGRHRS